MAGEGLAPVMGTAVRWVVVEAPTVAEGGEQAESETLRSSLHSLCREDS